MKPVCCCPQFLHSNTKESTCPPYCPFSNSTRKHMLPALLCKDKLQKRFPCSRHPSSIYPFLFESDRLLKYWGDFENLASNATTRVGERASQGPQHYYPVLMLEAHHMGGGHYWPRAIAVLLCLVDDTFIALSIVYSRMHTFTCGGSFCVILPRAECSRPLTESKRDSVPFITYPFAFS